MVGDWIWGEACGNGGGMGFWLLILFIDIVYRFLVIDFVIDFIYPIPQPLCTFDLSPLYTKLYVTHLFSPIKLHECSSPPAWKAMI